MTKHITTEENEEREWVERFDKQFGKPEKGFTIQTIDGRETCMMCGAPTTVDKVFQEMKSFIAQVEDTARDQGYDAGLSANGKYGEACYLKGLADALECLPKRRKVPNEIDGDRKIMLENFRKQCESLGFNDCLSEAKTSITNKIQDREKDL